MTPDPCLPPCAAQGCPCPCHEVTTGTLVCIGTKPTHADLMKLGRFSLLLRSYGGAR
jgi:hypothetical protein